MKTYTVVGATTEIGKNVARQLEAMGHRVRQVARSVGVPIDDTAALDQAFAGADAAYIMIPIDMLAPDLHQREEEIGERLAQAIKRSGIQRVVLLSSLRGLILPDKARTSAWGAIRMEEHLNALHLPETMYFRCAFFMENFTKGLGFREQAQGGTFMSAFRPDLAMPMIASQDIAARVIEALTADQLPDVRIRELQGARDYTMQEATKILAQALGNQPVTYIQVPLPEAHQAMLSAGVSSSFADAVMETAWSFNQGNSMTLEKRTPENTTPTTLEQWASIHIANQ